ncbi:cupin domain-containing protein [Paraliomyxa miuraensis]|uniref:hypothetical protein n=1 Tax=Paraliomyxa miuraensis TaxID=376150 RepID=UPI0022596A24|nr:hypothetical protein [Paraliomyxa miuraensis]MCX4241848.1 hypothetical protein [Paraliomyxa miuraensis]
MTVIPLDGHPREEELAAYVSDALDAPAAEQLETHVFDCSVCARRLERAASFQMVLHEAATNLELEVAAAAPMPVRRRGRRLGALGALWSTAAAVLFLVCQPGGVALDTEVAVIDPATAPASRMSPLPEPSVTGCDPSDPRCSQGLLASVDPLQSIDPLSTWPDDPFTALDDDPTLDGEPCGSGEDGGPLVCNPFSG